MDKSKAVPTIHGNQSIEMDPLLDEIPRTAVRKRESARSCIEYAVQEESSLSSEEQDVQSCEESRSSKPLMITRGTQTGKFRPRFQRPPHRSRGIQTSPKEETETSIPAKRKKTDFPMVNDVILSLFRQVIGIPVGTNCAPLLADLFLYSYENEFLDNMIRSGHRRLARSFNLCYRYMDDLIVFSNKKFLDYLKEIYPSQLTVEKANKSDHPADYLDLTFIIDSGGKLSTRLYDKRDDFDFHIVNFPYLSSNIPSGPSYGVYISQLIRYARCCSHYDDFRYRHKCLVDRLLSQGYI